MFVFRIFRFFSGNDWQYVSHRGNDLARTAVTENDELPMRPSQQGGLIG